MNKLSYLLLGIALLGTACDKSTKETPNGFKYKVVKAGDGVAPKVGQIIVFDYVLKDSKDSIWADTRELGAPAAVMVADTSALKTENGMVQMFRQLSKGDSVVIEMSIPKFFKEVVGGPVMKGIDTTRNISYLVKVNNISERKDYEAQQQEIMDKKTSEQLAKDTVIIDQYLAAKGVTANKTQSGIRYVITQAGKGENAATEKKVKVNYTGYLLDGNYFDTSVKAIAEQKGLFDPKRPYEPIDLIIDKSGVIKGWHEALKTLNKGAKGTFYIPSTLGYGPQRVSEVIGENSVLVFDIEMVDIK